MSTKNIVRVFDDGNEHTELKLCIGIPDYETAEMIQASLYRAYPGPDYYIEDDD